MQFVDYYEVLAVARTATQDEIKRAYRKLSKKFHPDINRAKGAEEKFKTVGEAYEVLKDPEKRRTFDQMRTQGFAGGQDVRPPSGWQNVDWNFRGAPGRGDPAASGFSDFFDAFFSGGPPGRAGRAPHQAARAGADQEVELTIALEDAYHGSTKTITLESPVVGIDGGRRADARAFTVKIPPGTTEGKKIRLAGQGGKGLGGGEDGDLLLRVHIDEHARFKLDGHELLTVVNVSPWEAMFGARVPCVTFDGEVQLKIPAASQAGNRLRLKDKGLPKHDGTRGALVVELRVVIPSQPTDDERRLFDELLRLSRFDPRA